MAMTPRHGHAEGKTTKVYNTWRGIRQRCNNPKASFYEIYGGAGIKVCPEWDKFEDFLIWAINSGQKDHLTIERRDSAKDYCPDNCYWADMSTQQSNKRKRKGCKSEFIGVVANKKKWSATITFRGNSTWLGTYETQEEAARVRDAFVIQNALPHKLNF